MCHVNKISELPYPDRATKSVEEILDRVDSNICGPFRTKALCGAIYFATFIDEKSRFCRVVPLRARSEIGDAFADYKAFVEKQTGRLIKSVRTDNAAEYVGGVFAKIVRESGIMHQTSVARCPQQNGIAERKNRTLVEMARCMLNESGLPDSVWVEAIQTANYIRNRCDTSALNNVTPFEAFWGIKPSVSHLQVFGSKMVSLNKVQNKNKLHEKGEVCKIVGYSSSQKGYRLIDNRLRVFINRNVRFLEENGSNSEPTVTINTNNIYENVKREKASPEIRKILPRACKQPLIEVGKRKQSPQKESAKKFKRSESPEHEKMEEEEEDDAEPL